MSRFNLRSAIFSRNSSSSHLSSSNTSLSDQSPSETSSIHSSENTEIALLGEYTNYKYNTVDAQFGSRLQALQQSMRNPDVSDITKQYLMSAINQYHRDYDKKQGYLPPYTKDSRPPYQTN